MIQLYHLSHERQSLYYLDIQTLTPLYYHSNYYHHHSSYWLLQELMNQEPYSPEYSHNCCLHRHLPSLSLESLLRARTHLCQHYHLLD